MRIDPFAAMAEYLGLQIGSRSLVDLALRNKSLRQLLEGAPGWRELITLGKIWHLDQQRDDRGRSVYDLIIVDAPATGHGVTFLDVPRVVHSAVRTGPLSRNAGMVEELIRDPERTLLLPVSLAEELPARETDELIDRVTNEVGIAVDRVVINAVAPPPFAEGLEDMDQRLAALPADLPLELLPPPGVMAECAAYLLSRHRLNRIYVDEIATSTGLPVLCLPYLPGGLQQSGALEDLGNRLLADPIRAPFPSAPLADFELAAARDRGAPP
jgi:anion-transporting  ArsA/GET3 family ATPase